MPVKVIKAGEIVDGYIVITAKPSLRFGPLLTSLETTDAIDPGPSWKFELVIGDGPSARQIAIDLSPFVRAAEYAQSFSAPIFIKPQSITLQWTRDLLLFRDRFFLSERLTMNAIEREEVVLRAKRIVYDEESEISALRAYVSNMEAAAEYQRSGPKREPIPDDVKLLVWSRDGGACVRCQSKEKLHFDHVIPVVKGGSNDAANVQLLCQVCNLKKSDRIAF